MNHLVYRVLFPETDEYYIGKHSTRDVNDGYLGSGRKLNERLRVGLLPQKEIVGFFPTEEEALLAEKKLIGDLWKEDALCLNKMPGGKGSFSHISHKGKPKSKEWREKIGASNRKPRKDKSKVLASAKLGAAARRGQKDSPEVKARRSASVSAATLGVPKPWLCKQIQVDSEIFSGLAAVEKATGLSKYVIRLRIKSDKYPNWTVL